MQKHFEALSPFGARLPPRARVRLLRLAASLLAALLVFCSPRAAAVEMHVFYGQGCPHCAEQHLFLDELQRTHPDLQVNRYEVWREDTHHRVFREMSASHGVDAGSVPTVFLDGRVWVGHSPRIAAEIEAAVAALPAGAGSAIRHTESAAPQPAAANARVVEIPAIGALSVRGDSLVYSTLLIAFVDGFNPCSFWVLTLLMGLVVHSGSRGRVVLVGGTFLLTTTLVYGTFLVGLFSVLGYVLYLEWVQWLVAGFAALFGLVNVKDYFWYQRGISFTISDEQKPGIYRRMRRVMASGGHPWALVAATAAMAAGVSLVELPCTAGFPVVWTALLAEQGIVGGAFLGLLALYLLVFLLDELTVFAVAVATLRVGRFEERQGRLLKLIGGMVMLALAFVMFWNPAVMNQLGDSLLVFGAAMAAALLIHGFASKMATGSDSTGR